MYIKYSTIGTILFVCMLLAVAGNFGLNASLVYANSAKELKEELKEESKFFSECRRVDEGRKVGNLHCPLFIVDVWPREANAQIRIMNIKPRYRGYMALPKGKYDIEVSAPGYKTERFWVNHQGTGITSKKVRLKCSVLTEADARIERTRLCLY